MLDRIDIHIEVPRVDYEKLSGNIISETSESIRKRVHAARNIQQARFANPNSKTNDIICDADIRIGEIRQFCQLQDEGVVLSLPKYQSLMRSATSCCACVSCNYRRTPTQSTMSSHAKREISTDHC